MTKLRIRPPKVNISAKGASFWKQIGMIVIGTTISLLFTLATAYLTDKHQRAKDRRLSAMMVMSNIETFSRSLEEHARYMASCDSAAAWLLSKNMEELERMPEAELSGLINQATTLMFLTYDKSAENIFSNNIETWKNMGNVQFIDRVGQCFSAMNMTAERWNGWVTEVEGTMRDIKDHPANYEGSTIAMKSLQSEKLRHMLVGIHYWRTWLSYMAATMRYQNLSNMAAIGITEQEVMDYTDAREQEVTNTNEEPDFNTFYTSPISPDSLTTMRRYDSILKVLNSEF